MSRASCSLFRVPSPVPVRRAVGRAGEAAPASCRRLRARGAGWCCSGGERWFGQEPPGSRVRRRGGAAGALVLHGACDAVVHTPYGPFVEALEHLVRGSSTRTSCGRRSAPRGRRADAPAARPAAQRSGRAAGAGARRPRHRAPSAAHGGRRTCLAAASASGVRSLLVLEDGHWADAPTLLLLRHLAQAAIERTGAAARHVPRHGGGGSGQALAQTLADLPALRRRRAPAAGGPLRRGGRRVRAARRRRAASSARRAARARAARSARSHWRQRVPGLRALAGAGGDRTPFAIGRRARSGVARGSLLGARDAQKRARGRQPAACARLAPCNERAARAGRHRRAASSSSAFCRRGVAAGRARADRRRRARRSAAG